MLLRAEWVVPIASEPILDGEVVIEDGTIVDVRPRRIDGQPATDCRDLGHAAILPGLVNAHSHIEYTVFRGMLEDMPFVPWVLQLTMLKSALDPDDWEASAIVGAAEAAAGGVTTLADCTDTGRALDGICAMGLRGIVYQEFFGITDEEPVARILGELGAKVGALRQRASGTHIRIGVSPHAPYTVRSELLSASADWARERGLPICIHAAESQAEGALMLDGTGPLGDRMRSRGIQWAAPTSSTVAHLDGLGALGSDVLLAHVAAPRASDGRLLRASGAAVVHCPKSNAKLGNGVAPLAWLRHHTGGTAARLGIGSDSVAATNRMDLFEEMRFGLLMQRVARRTAEHPSAAEMLTLATIGGARALDLDTEVGTLEPGKQADLAAVGLASIRTQPTHGIMSALVHACSACDVRLTMVAGNAVYDRGGVRCPELTRARRRLRLAAQKVARWKSATT